MRRQIFAQIFAETSIWIMIPGFSALSHQNYTFAFSLFACVICSFMHWSYVSVASKPSKIWHNLDRLCVIIIFIQLNKCTLHFRTLLLFLFFIGAILQAIASRNTRNDKWRIHAENLQFLTHLIARYFAFFACCWQTGHFSYDNSRTVGAEIVILVILYSVLYFLHIYLLSKLFSVL